MNFFGNTKNQIAESKHDLTNTTRLAIDINCAVDRIEGDLKKALDWISTADHVIVNLSANVQKTVNLTADRLERLNDRVTRLGDEMMVVGANLETLGADLDAVNEKVDAEICRVGDIATDARHDIDATTTLVKALLARIEKLEKYDEINRRVIALHVTKINTLEATLLAEAAGLVVEPIAVEMVDLPRPPLAEKPAARRARRRIRRTGAALPGVVASRSETAAVRDLPF